MLGTPGSALSHVRGKGSCRRGASIWRCSTAPRNGAALGATLRTIALPHAGVTAPGPPGSWQTSPSRGGRQALFAPGCPCRSRGLANALCGAAPCSRGRRLLGCVCLDASTSPALLDPFLHGGSTPPISTAAPGRAGRKFPWPGNVGEEDGKGPERESHCQIRAHTLKRVKPAPRT